MKYTRYLTILLCCACNNKSINIFPLPQQASSQIKYTSLALDTLTLEHINSSYIGDVGITPDNNICFIDKYYCWLFTFDSTGKAKERFIGQGKGPGETSVGKIAGHCFLADSSLFILGFQLDHYLHKNHFKENEMFFLQKNKSNNLTKAFETYTHQYDNLICRSFKGCVYFNMYSEHNGFNYLDHTERYLNECRNISEINLQEQKASRMLGGGYPDIYKNNSKKYLIFSAVNFDINQDGEFYVNYEADSLIYKYDHNYNPICSFGFAGKDIDMNFKTINSYKECRKNYQQEKASKGYYSSLEYEDKTRVLFRSYQKGEHLNNDGLQIYVNQILIADVEVPKKFKVIGYIAPYYYSSAAIDEENEIIRIFRFKLN